MLGYALRANPTYGSTTGLLDREDVAATFIE